MKISRFIFLWMYILNVMCLAELPDVPIQIGLSDNIVRLSSSETIEFVWVPDLNIWVGKYEVTLGQFVQLSKSARSRPSSYAGGDVVETNIMISPAVMVGYQDAVDACSFMNKRYGVFLKDNYVFRLPSENEWETIAKCGSERNYPWGNEWPPTIMADGILPNLRGEEVIALENSFTNVVGFIPGHFDHWPSVAPVANSGANEWGIFGVAGNVSEWVEGWYDEKRDLRLQKGSDAFTHQSLECLITSRSAVEGQSPLRGLFFWGEVRNAGHNYSGFRIVVGPITTVSKPAKQSTAPN